MNSSLQSGSLKIGTIMGIPIRIHFSWLIIFGLLTWSLSTFYFPSAAPQLREISYWIGGTAAALLLFISVALHELAHSFIAIRFGQSISSITLFIFGGVAQMKDEPAHPRAEFRMAIAGPLSSLLLSLIFFLSYYLVKGQVVKALFQYLSQVNLIIGVFNLIPGFPMDGGRLVRAFIWKKTKDFFYATRKASHYGQNIALFFIIFGLLSLFIGFTSGLWLMFIGWFLHTAAQASYQQASLQEILRGVKVKDVMVKDIITISPDITIDTAVNEYFLKYGYGGFPIMDNGKFLGILTLKEIKNIPKERWRNTTIFSVLIPHDNRWEISPEEDAMKALEVMISEDKGRLVVTEKGKVIGLITRNGIARYVQMKGETRR
jgi:Zn-dependent protease/predicted transcriptional regulator